MAQPTKVFTTAPGVLFVKNVKVANLTGHDLSIRTNSQKTPTSDGLAISRGFQMGDVSMQTIETVDGQSRRLDLAAANGEIIVAQFYHGGSVHQVEGTFDEVSKRSIVDRGTTEGTYKFSGAYTLI